MFGRRLIPVADRGYLTHMQENHKSDNSDLSHDPKPGLDSLVGGLAHTQRLVHIMESELLPMAREIETLFDKLENAGEKWLRHTDVMLANLKEESRRFKELKALLAEVEDLERRRANTVF